MKAKIKLMEQQAKQPCMQESISSACGDGIVTGVGGNTTTYSEDRADVEI